MCQTTDNNQQSQNKADMVQVGETKHVNGVNGHNHQLNKKDQPRNPYAPRYADFLSNISNFKIIESTLREGEQFANAFFDTKTKIAIAKALDAFGVEYIELTSPAASEQSRLDCEAICKLGLKAKILTHIRCHMDDARIAVETGKDLLYCFLPFARSAGGRFMCVDGVDVVIGTSSFLREFSHGKDMAYITKTAIEVINFVKSKGIEIRFSSEDSFRSDLVDLLSIYQTVDKIGVNRVGIADTVGCANPRQVYDLVRTLRGVVSCDIEVHLHNDTGMAIANAYTALEAGATHIDTSVLGIGERVGITPLGGLVACLYAADPDYVKSKYNLPMLREIENLVAEAVEVSVPFMNPITGYCAFTHKAGIHAKAILNNPSTYEILKPEDFGLTRYVSIGHRLTGWNAVKSRVEQLKLVLTDDQIKDATAKIKELADVRTQSMEDVDTVLRVYHSGVASGELEIGDRQMFDRLLRRHRDSSVSRADVPQDAIEGATTPNASIPNAVTA
ncbi:11299_t:CDS:2 [Acaulospora colombiana]|uniref:11299_t:CDS:1 n=1 Tax=Acaulospora colombiana TaxID=27376 RepID=A0ACA9NNR1_9GLOM|nr:11299_t:CDS:2 [Acaulospora colombiana]